MTPHERAKAVIDAFEAGASDPVSILEAAFADQQRAVTAATRERIEQLEQRHDETMASWRATVQRLEASELGHRATLAELEELERRRREDVTALTRARERLEKELVEAEAEAERQKKHNARLTASLDEERRRRKQVQQAAIAAKQRVRMLEGALGKIATATINDAVSFRACARAALLPTPPRREGVGDA